MSKFDGIVEPGDTLFLFGDGWIERVTFSRIRHVGIVFDEDFIFETDIWKRRAGFNTLDTYDNRHVEVWGTKDIDHNKVQDLCEKYNKSPYSWLDIANNFWTAPLHPEIRKKIVAALGNKYFMICSEISARIIYEATGYEHLKDYEALEPCDLLKLYLEHPEYHFRKTLAQT